MPVDLIWRDSGVIYKGSGSLTGPEIVDANRIICSDSRWLTATFKIVDMIDAVTIQASDSELDELVQLDIEGGKINSSAKIIIIFDKDKDDGLTSIVMGWFNKILGDAVSEARFAKTMDEAKVILGRTTV